MVSGEGGARTRTHEYVLQEDARPGVVRGDPAPARGWSGWGGARTRMEDVPVAGDAEEGPLALVLQYDGAEQVDTEDEHPGADDGDPECQRLLLSSEEKDIERVKGDDLEGGWHREQDK